MGRLYSGNLNAHRNATLKLQSLGFIVREVEFYSVESREHCMRIYLEDATGRPFMDKGFGHYDIDCLYISATAWLDRMYDQLKDWK